MSDPAMKPGWNKTYGQLIAEDYDSDVMAKPSELAAAIDNAIRAAVVRAAKEQS